MRAGYRDATAADLPAIDRLFRASFAATFGQLYGPADLAAFFARFTPEAWAERLATNRFHLAEVAGENGGEPVGYAQLGTVTMPTPHTAGDRELRQLYLAQNAKGTGIADALMRWTIDTARAEGAATLFLSVYVDNARAIRFYRRYGFDDIGAYAFMVGDHEDEDRIMSLTL